MALIEIKIVGSDSSGQAFGSAAEGVRGLGEAAGQSQSRLSGMVGFLGGAAAGGALALGGALVGAATKGLMFNNSMEQARAKINAFTKDGEATTEILQMVSDRAAKTPFAFEEMAEAAAGLGPAAKSAGIPLEDLIEQAEVLAASNPSEGLVGATFSLKEALSGDFASAIERFNLSRSYINQLKAEGVPALEIVRQAMAQAGYDTSLVAEMANTAEGRWSTFMDTWTTLAGKVTQPIFDAVSRGLGQANDLLTQFSPQMTAFADALGGWIAGAIQSAGQGLQVLAGAFSAAGGGMQGVMAVLQLLGESIMTWVGEQLPGWQASLTQMGQAAVQWIVDATPPALAQLQSWGGQILGWVMANLPGWQAQLMAWGQMAWQWIQDATPPALAQLAAWGGQLLGYLAANLPGWIAQLLVWGQQAVKWVADAIPPLLVNAGQFLGQLISWGVGTALPAIIGWGVQAAVAMIGWVATELIPKVGPALLGFLGELVSGLGKVVAGIAEAALAIGAGIIDGIASGISKGVGAIIGAARDAAQSALDAALDFLGIKSPSRVFAAAVGLPIAQGMALGIRQGVPLVAGAAAGVAGAGVSAAQGAVSRGTTVTGGITQNIYQQPGQRGDQLAREASRQILAAAEMRR